MVTRNGRPRGESASWYLATSAANESMSSSAKARWSSGDVKRTLASSASVGSARPVVVARCRRELTAAIVRLEAGMRVSLEKRSRTGGGGAGGALGGAGGAECAGGDGVELGGGLEEVFDIVVVAAFADGMDEAGLLERADVVADA